MVRAIVGCLMKGCISNYLDTSSQLCRNGYFNGGGGGGNFITEKSENFRFFLHGGN